MLVSEPNVLLVKVDVIILFLLIRSNTFKIGILIEECPTVNLLLLG